MATPTVTNPDDLASGTSPGMELVSDAEHELSREERTLPRILLGEVIWQPIRPEDLGAQSQESSLLDSLRRPHTFPIGDDEPARDAASEEESTK